MKNVFHEAINELDQERPIVVATVAHTKGSTPQKPGAKLLVRNDGSGVGTLGGGCVEGDIWFAASQILKSGGKAEYREYHLNEDLAAQDGLVCGGTMYFLIDPIYESKEYKTYAEEIEEAYEGGIPVALASLNKPADQSETTVGAKMFSRQGGYTEGTLGNSEIDLEASARAEKLMVHGKNEFVTDDKGAEYFIEAYTTPPQIVLCGGGHVSKAIYTLAKSLGFRVYITDDRQEFANEERFPDIDGVVALKPEDALPNLPINPNTFIVVATRGHRYDNVALEAAAKTPAKYVGLMGSKRKTIMIYEDLVRSGLALDRIREIRSPIGLDIHARTPDEIAVSIMAEILMFRLGGTGLPMKLSERDFDRIVNKVKGSSAVPG